MSAAIAICVAVVCVTGALLTLALALRSAERARGDQKARGDTLDVNLTGLAAQLADMTNRLREEKARADALDDLLAAYAVSGPVDGEYDRLLQEWRTVRAPNRDGARVVPAPASASQDDPDRLLDPGE